MKLAEQTMKVLNFINMIGENIKEDKFLMIRNQHNFILFTSNKYNLHSIPTELLNSDVYRLDIENDFFVIKVFTK